jgi:hypothetical protein
MRLHPTPKSGVHRGGAQRRSTSLAEGVGGCGGGAGCQGARFWPTTTLHGVLPDDDREGFVSENDLQLFTLPGDEIDCEGFVPENGVQLFTLPEN